MFFRRQIKAWWVRYKYRRDMMKKVRTPREVFDGRAFMEPDSTGTEEQKVMQTEVPEPALDGTAAGS